jgi:hypothetical protein
MYMRLEVTRGIQSGFDVDQKSPHSATVALNFVAAPQSPNCLMRELTRLMSRAAAGVAARSAMLDRVGLPIAQRTLREFEIGLADFSYG